MTSLTDTDLYANRNRYSEQELIDNLDTITLYAILVSQKVSAEFCVQYFWHMEDKYMKDEHDDIYLHQILKHQPHISEEDLHTCPTFLARLAAAGRL